MKNNSSTYFFRMFFAVMLLLFSMACSKHNRGVTNQSDFKARNPPSVKLKNEYDKAAKKSKKGSKILRGKEGKALEKALDKQRERKLRKDQRYLKRKRRKMKRDN